jgi:hypothetical protein
MVGIDISAALKLGAARGSNLAMLSELLPAAEAGLAEAVWSDQVQNDRPLPNPAMSADCLLAAIATHMRHISGL